LHFIPDPQTIALELEAHRIALIVVPQTSLLDTYRRLSGLVVTTAPWNSQAALILNANTAVLRDPAVRRAISAAVPYEEIVADVTRGLYQLPRNSIPQTALGYVPLPARRLNIARAKRLLDASGWRVGADGGIRTRDGVRLSMTLDTIAGATNFERSALLMQASFRAAGIDLAIRTYPYRTIFVPLGPIYSGKYEIAYYSNTLNWDPDVYNFLGCDRWYPKGQNIFRFCDPKLDRLERAGLQTDDPRLRAEIYRRATTLIWSDVPYVPVYDARRLIVRSADLRNYRPNMTSTPWWNAWEWDI
jgi:peptide/nickel transport system substrate-binding protein